MALDSYANLQAAIADQLARSDLTAQIPDFIRLFEAEAARELFRQRLTETYTTLTTVSGSASLPADYMGWREVAWQGTETIVLSYLHPAMLDSYYPTPRTGVPQAFCIFGSTIQAAPFDDTAPLALIYYAKLPALASSLNWLLTNHPDAYFFGALEQAYLYTKDFEQSQPWLLKKTAVFDQIKKLQFREPGLLEIRAAAYTP